MRKKTYSFVTLLLLALPALTHALGLMVYPMEQYVKPGIPVFYTASNQMDRPLAVEISVEKWNINDAGEEIGEPTTDLIIFPTQFALKTKENRRVKVVSREKQPLDNEKCYRVTIKELPIQFKDDPGQQSQVYMANAYRTSFYLLPKGGKGSIKMINSKLEDTILSIQLENPGTLHTYTNNPVIALEFEDGEKVELESDDHFKEFTGQNLHAKMKRTFHLNLKDAGIDKKIISGSLKMRNERGVDIEAFPLSL
jgi:P pilus assembly chaperone PapD